MDPSMRWRWSPAFNEGQSFFCGSAVRLEDILFFELGCQFEEVRALIPQVPDKIVMDHCSFCSQEMFVTVKGPNGLNYERTYENNNH
jgi:hypothetical protein